jgi:signal transduction histidine kinase
LFAVDNSLLVNPVQSVHRADRPEAIRRQDMTTHVDPMSGTGSLDDEGRRALAGLGARVAAAYLMATVAGLLTGSRSGTWYAAWPSAAGVGLAGLVAVPCVAALSAAPDLSGSSDLSRARGPFRLRSSRGTALAAQALVVLAGCAALVAVCAAAPVISWEHVHPVVGWAVPAIGLGLAVAAGPRSGLVAFAVMAACFVVLTPVQASAAVPGTLIGASVSVVVGSVLHVGARRAFAAAEGEIRAAEDAEEARVHAERRLRARRRTDRVLHDTLLSTLTLLAHGGAGVDPEEVRAACRRDLTALRDGRWLRGEATDLDGSAGPAAAAAAGAGADGDGAGAIATAGVMVAGAGSPLARRLEALQELALRKGLELRVHLQDPLRRPVGPTAAAPGPPVLTPDALAAWSGALAECVVNIARHADVAAADVVLGCTDDVVVTVVVDEGSGFEPDQVGPQRLGLSGSVQDRVRDVGGRARVWSRPGQGTVVEIELPRIDAGRGEFR